MPTLAEIEELYNNTTAGDGGDSVGFIANYNGSGTSGLLRKSKINGQSIFFPAGGLLGNQYRDYVNQDGYY